jgi:hypothetical protein
VGLLLEHSKFQVEIAILLRSPQTIIVRIEHLNYRQQMVIRVKFLLLMDQALLLGQLFQVEAV